MEQGRAGIRLLRCSKLRCCAIGLRECLSLKHETEVAKTAKATPAETSGYVIVLASKVAKKNAETFVSTLHKQGLNEARVATRNNVTRVVYGNYTTQQDAYNALNKLNDKEPFAEGWVMKIN